MVWGTIFLFMWNMSLCWFGSNDHTTLKSMVNCESLGLEEAFQNTCFEDTMSKACHNGAANHSSLTKRKFEGEKFTWLNHILYPCVYYIYTIFCSIWKVYYEF